jgi:putative oxidoreductase
MRRKLFASRVTGTAASLVALLRVAAAAVFIGFGVVKFTAHEEEAEAFDRYGLPDPELMAYAVGVLEIAGGLLLLVGLGTRLAAIALAANMAVAVAVSGIKEGEAISLTLAPALLVVMVLLLWAGPGAHALDRRYAA